MFIKKANLSHLDQLALLFDAYRVFYGQVSDIPAAKQFLSERISQDESVIYVAEESDYHLIGFVQLYPLFSSTRMKKLWLLNDLFVDHEYRGQGVSILLIDEAKKLARATNACGLMLETAISNIIGNQLYPRSDFELDKEHNHYFWNNR